MAESLDLSRLLLIHTGLSLVAALSVSPAWNLPLALYGLVIVQGEGSGEGIRQFAGLLAGSTLLDILWLLSSWRHETSSLPFLLILVNFSLKPITLLAALGNLRQRGESTFSLPSNFSLPGSFPGASNFPSFGNQNSGQSHSNGGAQTVWSAPPYQGFAGDEEAEVETARPPIRSGGAGPGGVRTAAAPAPPTVSRGAEGGGYHSLE